MKKKKNRHFLTIFDLTAKEIGGLIKRAIRLKAGKDAGKCPLIGKSIGLLFEKASTRTRVSLQVGIYQLGAQTLYMNPKEIQIGRGETVSDTARVLSRYLDAMIIRTASHKILEEFTSYASIPIINGLSDLHHPCQALADLMTIQEKKGSLRNVQFAYIGDGNNVANSLIEAASRTGMKLLLACPKGYDPDPDIYRRAKEKAQNIINVVTSPEEAARNADVLYTDVWISMGQEKETAKRRKSFKKYQLNAGLLALAKYNAIVLHCMPAHRGEEITSDVMDGKQSVVFDQAENRLHTQKALLEFLLT
jgi:ornithine carbamoyltransferase